MINVVGKHCALRNTTIADWQGHIIPAQSNVTVTDMENVYEIMGCYDQLDLNYPKPQINCKVQQKKKKKFEESGRIIKSETIFCASKKIIFLTLHSDYFNQNVRSHSNYPISKKYGHLKKKK